MYPDPEHCINAIPLFVSVADPDPSDPYFFGLLDPDPDPLVRGPGMDLDPDLSIIKQK